MTGRRLGNLAILRLRAQGKWWPAAVLVLAASALPAPQADAATYSVWSCRGPLGGPVSTAAWKPSTFDDDFGPVVVDDDCDEGGELLLTLSPFFDYPSPSRPTALADFDFPHGTSVVEYTLWRSIDVAASFPGADYHYVAAVREREEGGISFEEGCASVLSLPSFDCTEVGDPNQPLDEENRFERSALQLEGLQLWAGCMHDGCEAPPSPPSAELRLFRSRVVLEDLLPPSPPQLDGSLVDGGPLADTATLVVQSRDSGGGVAAMTLSVDGQPPQVRTLDGPGGSCEEPYTLPRPCPAEAARGFVVDLDGLTPGAHSAAGTIVDAAGNVTAFGPLTFTVAAPDVSEPVDRGEAPATTQPAPIEARLRLRDAVVEQAPGARARLSGTLTNADGAPIPGARLSVATRRLDDPAEPARPLPAVLTSASGGFALTVPGTGARLVTVSFAQPGAAPTSAEAVVRSRTSLSLTRSPARLRRGQRVVLSGRLRGAGEAAKGAVVELQAIVSGRWRAVATVRAAAGGSYRWRYRFAHVSRDTIFSFRALVRDTPGWPWPTLRSRPVEVRVDGA